MSKKDALKDFAFWLALLCILLLLAHFWRGAVWLSDTILLPEFGALVTTWVLRPLVFVCLLMVGLFAARATLASSIGIIALTVLAKLPV